MPESTEPFILEKLFPAPPINCLGEFACQRFLKTNIPKEITHFKENKLKKTNKD